ncbi:MAG: hypothetical protein ACF8PN_12825 [Phycisphaerales bacterium]
MHTNRPALGIALLAGFGLSSAVFAQPVIDGTADAIYDTEAAVQDTQTQFGDNSDPDPGFANGSELDGVYSFTQDGVLYMVLSGNLESNFNKLEIFIDSVPGGQNRLRGDNPDVDFNGLNRMGDDGNGNGLTFDAGFEADYWISMTGGPDGDGRYQLFANYAKLRTDNDQGIGAFLGSGRAQSDGTLQDGDNFPGIRMTIDNSNVGGVIGGCDPDDGAGVPTGIEMAIPLTAIGNPFGSIKVCAFVNGGGHDFMSNQVLKGIGGGCNLGEPRNVDFNTIAGDQFATLTGGFGTEPFSLLTSPLTAGGVAQLMTMNGTPNARHYFGYSLTGLGSTPVPPLGVTADLDNPTQIGSATADSTGSATISRGVPNSAQGARVYMQALENGDKTNVVARIVN